VYSIKKPKPDFVNARVLFTNIMNKKQCIKYHNVNSNKLHATKSL